MASTGGNLADVPDVIILLKTSPKPKPRCNWMGAAPEATTWQGYAAHESEHQAQRQKLPVSVRLDIFAI